MAGKKFRVTTPATGVALVAATAKTALQLVAAANTPVVVPWIEVSFNGNAPTNVPVELLIERQTSVIGGSPTALTPSEVPNGAPGTLQTTAAASTGGAEPTGSDDYHKSFLHPQGRHVILGPFEVVGGDRLGVVLTAPDAVNVHITLPGEE